MPRRRGGGGMGGRKRSMFSSPAPASKAPPPAVPQRQSGGGFLGTMMQGFALGTGSAIAHEAIHAGVRSMSGGSEQPAAEQQQQQVAAGGAEVCGAQQKAFLDCMSANNGEMSMCQYYFDAMKTCKVQLGGGGPGGDSLQY